MASVWVKFNVWKLVWDLRKYQETCLDKEGKKIALDKILKKRGILKGSFYAMLNRGKMGTKSIRKFEKFWIIVEKVI